MRLTEFASPSSIAAVLSSAPLPMERTRNVLLGVLYSHERLTRLLPPILSRGGPRTFLWYKLAILYGLSASLRIFRSKSIFLWPIDRNSADYLIESIARSTDTLLH